MVITEFIYYDLSISDINEDNIVVLGEETQKAMDVDAEIVLPKTDIEMRNNSKEILANRDSSDSYIDGETMITSDNESSITNINNKNIAITGINKNSEITDKKMTYPQFFIKIKY